MDKKPIFCIAFLSYAFVFTHSWPAVV